MRYLRQQPRTVFGFLEGSGVVGHVHQVHGSGEIAVQFAQVCCARESGDIAWTDVEHPLRGFHGVVIVAQFRIRVGQVAIDCDVIGGTFVERGGGYQRLGELVAAEKQPGLHFQGFEIIRLDLEGAVQSLFGFRVERDIRSFAGAARVGHGESAVVGNVIWLLGDLRLSFLDADFGWRRRGGLRGLGADHYGGQNTECTE